MEIFEPGVVGYPIARPHWVVEELLAAKQTPPITTLTSGQRTPPMTIGELDEFLAFTRAARQQDLS